MNNCPVIQSNPMGSSVDGSVPVSGAPSAAPVKPRARTREQFETADNDYRTATAAVLEKLRLHFEGHADALQEDFSDAKLREALRLAADDLDDEGKPRPRAWRRTKSIR